MQVIAAKNAHRKNTRQVERPTVQPLAKFSRVSSVGTMLGSVSTRCEGLKALTAIQTSGYSMNSPNRMRPAWRTTLLRRRRCVIDVRCRAVVDGTGAVMVA